MLFENSVPILGLVFHIFACVTSSVQSLASCGIFIGLFNDIVKLEPSCDMLSIPALGSELKNNDFVYSIKDFRKILSKRVWIS